MKTSSRVAILIVCLFTLVAATGSAPVAQHRVQTINVIADGTGPIPTCRPGSGCKPDDNLRQIADGTGPIPTCRPGSGCKPDDNLREIADGTGPIPTCRPGSGCKPDDNLREMLTIEQPAAYYSTRYAS